jgi:hypothetical protein
VLLVGSNLAGAAGVTFGGAAATGVHFDTNANALVVVTPPHAEGFVDVVVTNPDGQTATAPGFHFGPPPAPTSFTPTSFANGAAGQLVTITGTSFSDVQGVQVMFSGFLGTVVAKSPTELTVAIPKLNPGVFYQVIVTNFDGQFGLAPGTLSVGGP